MVTRMIYCPGPDMWVTVAAYVKAVKMAKANPDTEFKQGLTCWWSCTGADIMKQFMRGVDDRINQGISYSDRGR